MGLVVVGEHFGPRGEPDEHEEDHQGGREAVTHAAEAVAEDVHRIPRLKRRIDASSWAQGLKSRRSGASNSSQRGDFARNMQKSSLMWLQRWYCEGFLHKVAHHTGRHIPCHRNYRLEKAPKGQKMPKVRRNRANLRVFRQFASF